ncbi:MAG: AAA family ATPase [Lachnospiraceae bacterium]
MGKTSVFDIIEFCLTGSIKRIEKYNEELAIKKTEAFENKILISDETKKAFVKISFDNRWTTCRNKIYILSGAN